MNSIIDKWESDDDIGEFYSKPKKTISSFGKSGSKEKPKKQPIVEIVDKSKIVSEEETGGQNG